MKSTIAFLTLLFTLASATTYPRIESWSGDGFFDGFTFPASTYDNTTNGDVFWATAQNTSLLYVNDAGRVILKVDNTTSVVYNDKRYAPKLLSKTAYPPGTVWVMDAVHMPYGCSVWPAFWTQGLNWPLGGEIDIMEGINQVTTNQIALHTEGQGCLASTSNTASFSGTVGQTNCSTAANEDEGCIVTTTDQSSYGEGFAAAGGGVYVAEYAEDAIRVWFLSREAVPSSLTANTTSLDTSTLGEPVAEYLSSTCDFSTYFTSQILTIDITLCGDFAGVPALLAETCPALQGDATCYTTYVINDQQATYANAYFEINYVAVYQASNASTSSTSGSSAATSSVSGSSGATGTITAGAGSASASSSQTSTGAASGAFRLWMGDGATWAVLVGAGLLAGMGLAF
ncbi:concanavalin A-like lectin/glucanase domain-containing protein [Naematelia encephala]|uniref:Concanavalin A-like lectin/glucanase domain-containing protein n=1 Tax=Naematelia encephala TaxID=71784 RepID=A0A1Y2B668_9TREE|nr:concanavalin A-like lectin/glucanase domain-containing protein [Naematelia encephala]